ncbi:hypothetical protein AN396_08850 [Candidatus Epulonipiscium fishelsonii]|uniref:Uncharacterized protein n=1 Tax=Candidatus Epulonipiscium fishelsonii TaxID=77094 RepID=A0ACC8XAH3_9FIRM|nr:hypothetical protein AN396_08850 [Epulopiscium sp. SCG-B11WGA-EpuloA1]
MKEVLILKLNFKGKIISYNKYASLRLDLKATDDIYEIIIPTNHNKVKSLLRTASKNRNKLSTELIFKDATDRNVYTMCIVEYNITMQEIEISAIQVNRVSLTSDKNKHSKKLFYDDLTKIPNKEYFESYFYKNKHLIKDAALIYLDIDNFKSINDSLTRKAGDRALTTIASRLQNVDYSDYIVGRIVGDEFIILLKSVKTKERVEEFLNIITKTFNEPFVIGNVTFVVSYSAGIAMYPVNGRDFEELFDNATIALNKAKANGKRQYSFYDDRIKSHVLRKVYMESEIREGLKNEEFSLFYQPQIDVNTKKIVGFEALVRWIKPDGQIIPPFKFIPIAEETRLMVPMGTWILKEACLFINRLKDKGYSDFSVAVNISGIQIAEDNFVQIVKAIITETNININNLHFEITESVLMTDMEQTTEKIKQLKDMGISIALDDFGTGYSSLTYLKNFPINILKIEKNFVDDIGTNRKNLVGVIIDLGHELGLEVVAEGIEHIEQLKYLEDYKCNIIQGYIISKPLPENELLDFIEEYNF